MSIIYAVMRIDRSQGVSSVVSVNENPLYAEVMARIANSESMEFHYYVENIPIDYPSKVDLFHDRDRVTRYKLFCGDKEIKLKDSDVIRLIDLVIERVLKNPDGDEPYLISSVFTDNLLLLCNKKFKLSLEPLPQGYLFNVSPEIQKFSELHRDLVTWRNIEELNDLRNQILAECIDLSLTGWHQVSLNSNP